MGTNGHGKRPFGPHGEGCDCDPENPQEHPEPEHETEKMKVISFHQDDSHPIEIILLAVAEAYASAFAKAVNTCGFDGQPLSHRQLSHLLAGVMQGHGLARQSTDIIMAEYYSALQQVTAEKESSGARNLQDISELFHRKPDEPDADESS